MTEIVLCNQPFRTELLAAQCGINVDHLLGSGCIKPSMIHPYRPYLVSESPSPTEQEILNRLSPARISQNLTDLSLSLGENTQALANITAKLQEYNVDLMGASTSVYAARMQGFGSAVKTYQAALMEYRQAVKTNPAMGNAAKQKVLAAFQKMQRGFQHELAAVNAASRARRGTPLSNVTRGANIARSSRNVTKLNVMSQVQASNLVKFGQYGKYLGNGLAVIDFGSRVGNVHNSYQSGGNWERDLFIESSSFAVSAGAGMLAVSAGSAALTFLMVATPVGWVGLVIGGIVVAGTAAATTIAANDLVKSNSGGVYDSIMNYLGAL